MTVQEQRDVFAAYLAAQSAIRAGSMLDMFTLWPIIDVRRLEETYPAWEQAVTTLVQRDASRLDALAAQYVREAMAAADVLEAATIVTDQLNMEKVTESLRITSVVALRESLAAGKTLEQASASAQTQSAGAAVRHALDSGRNTTRRSTVASGGRWARVASPGACAFCRMLAARGQVYSEDTVRFASHDWCNCGVASQFGPIQGEEGLVSRTFVPSTKNITATDRARVRAWLREHPDAA